jgi:hypothetical protein
MDMNTNVLVRPHLLDLDRNTDMFMYVYTEI